MLKNKEEFINSVKTLKALINSDIMQKQYWERILNEHEYELKKLLYQCPHEWVVTYHLNSSPSWVRICSTCSKKESTNQEELSVIRVPIWE